jgi:nucleoside-diphosphate-sugar epimerase
MRTTSTIVITGTAGLVGQNLADLLASRGDCRVIGIDKPGTRLALLERRHPSSTWIAADLSEPGPWEEALGGADVVVQLQAQICGSRTEEFERNTLTTTRRILERMRQAGVPYLVHVSSSAVFSKARDDYSDAKKAQEDLVLSSNLPCCVLRPTLMYGPFDPKHLGWLAGFMGRVPFLPIPGHGRYPRQPIYVGDFCQAIDVCTRRRPERIFDLAGAEHIHYIDLLRSIRRMRGLYRPFVKVPIPVFASLLRSYARLVGPPPFTVDQLKALTIGDDFPGADTWAELGIEPTSFAAGVRMTFGLADATGSTEPPAPRVHG